jgi:hypothetical protein
MTDEWRPVVGWEGFYEVTRDGRVRSLPRICVRRNGTTQPMVAAAYRREADLCLAEAEELIATVRSKP